MESEKCPHCKADYENCETYPETDESGGYKGAENNYCLNCRKWYRTEGMYPHWNHRD